MSWQAVNDLSAHPATTGAPYQGNSVILNALGDLTNRENRFAYQRFSSDFQNLAGALVPGGDGLSDDFNGDNVPDYYPTLYPTVLRADQRCRPAHLLIPADPGHRQALSRAMAFPFVFPGAYSVPQTLTNGRLRLDPLAEPGGQHRLAVCARRGDLPGKRQRHHADLSPEHQPQSARHRRQPEHPGQRRAGITDLVGLPDLARDALSLWNDPTYPVNGAPAPYNLAAGQPTGLAYTTGQRGTAGRYALPAMTAPYHSTNPQPYNDGFGSTQPSSSPARRPAGPLVPV